MTVLDRETLDEAYLVAAEIAVFEPQRAATLLAEFRQHHHRGASWLDRIQAEDGAGHVWAAMIDAWEAPLFGALPTWQP